MTRKALAAIGLGTVLACLSVACERAQKGRAAQEPPAQKQPSEKAHAYLDFVLTDQDGSKVTLADYAGKVIVLEWTNPDCPFVRRHYSMGTMVDLARRYALRDVVWLAVNSTQGYDRARNKAWHWARSLPYPVLDDHTGRFGRLLVARASPHMFILDKTGEVVYSGAIDDDVSGDKDERVNYVQRALEEILAGKLVSTARTRPYGCTIKYAPREAAGSS